MKPSAYQKLGNSPGVGKCPAPGSEKFAYYPPPGLKRQANAQQQPGGLGAAGID